MLVQPFRKWFETANAAQRCAGVDVLARAWAEGRVASADQAGAEAALLLAADDPSPKVRLTLASALAGSRVAPRTVIAILSRDTDRIAVPVVERSPMLAEEDLVELAACGSPQIQLAIARRRPLSARVCAVLARYAAADACLELLDNEGAGLGAAGYRWLDERFGEDAAVRSAMLERSDLPVSARQSLIRKLGDAFSTSPLVSGAVGEARARMLASEACERATTLLAENIDADEVPALVDHLRITGQLTAGFLLRAVCLGNIDLFASALVSLTGASERRVRAIVVDGREQAFTALVEAAGLPPALAPLLRCAVQVWKEAVAGTAAADADEVAMRVMQRLVTAFRERREEAGFEELSALLHKLAGETTRDCARSRARRMAA